MPDLTEMQTEMIRLSRLLDAGLEYLRVQAVEFAEAENAYRMARAKAYLESEGTVEMRKSIVDLATPVERVAAHLAEGMSRATLEAVRARRQQISAWQTLVSANRVEAEFARTGPLDGP